MQLSFKDVNLGHLLTIATIIVGLSAGWQALNGRVEALERNDDRQDRQLAELTQAIKEMLNGVQSDRLENGKAIAEIRVDVGYVRRWVEDVKRTEKGQ